MNNDFVKVPEEDKTLSPGKLFYNWFAANIGIMGFVYGAIIVSYRLSFWQSITAALIGVLTFAIPGWVALIGRREGVTTFKMSRAAFGTYGNNKLYGLAQHGRLVGRQCHYRDVVIFSNVEDH